MADYYIDGVSNGDGTIGSPASTIPASSSDTTYYIKRGADIPHAVSANYAPAIRTVYDGESWGNQSDPIAKLRCPNTLWTQFRTDTSYVTLRGLHMIGGSRQVQITGAGPYRGILITRCILDTADVNNIRLTDAGALGGADNDPVRIIENVITRSRTDNIFMLGETGPLSNILIEGNKISYPNYNNTISDGDCIQISGNPVGQTLRNIVIRGNTLLNNTTTRFVGKHSVILGSTLDNGAGNIIANNYCETNLVGIAVRVPGTLVQGNTVVGLSGSTYLINIEPDYASTAPIIVSSNVLVGNNLATRGIYCYFGAAANPNIYVYNNYIKDVTYQFVRVDTNGAGGNMSLINNVFHNSTNPSSALVFFKGTRTLTSSNNRYYQEMASGWQVLASPDRSTLSATQGDGYETNSTLGDPMVNSSYRPQTGSPLIGIGAHIGYRTDASGAQFWNPPSIGAYEYVRPRTAR